VKVLILYGNLAFQDVVLPGTRTPFESQHCIRILSFGAPSVVLGFLRGGGVLITGTCFGHYVCLETLLSVRYCKVLIIYR
jgi:hypothetical protein